MNTFYSIPGGTGQILASPTPLLEYLCVCFHWMVSSFHWLIDNIYVNIVCVCVCVFYREFPRELRWLLEWVGLGCCQEQCANCELRNASLQSKPGGESLMRRRGLHSPSLLHRNSPPTVLAKTLLSYHICSQTFQEMKRENRLQGLFKPET